MRDATKQAERLAAIRLRYAINTHLEDRGATGPTAIGAAVGLPAAEAVSLLIPASGGTDSPVMPHVRRRVIPSRSWDRGGADGSGAGNPDRLGESDALAALRPLSP